MAVRFHQIPLRNGRDDSVLNPCLPACLAGIFPNGHVCIQTMTVKIKSFNNARVTGFYSALATMIQYHLLTTCYRY